MIALTRKLTTQTLTHEEIRDELARLIKVERLNTNKFLAMLKKAEDERSFVKFDYVSLYDWLVRFFNYPSPSAMRRIEAVRLMRAVPNVQERLEDGALNLTTLNKAQQVIKAQEKATGEKISAETKTEAIKEIENLSTKTSGSGFARKVSGSGGRRQKASQ